MWYEAGELLMMMTMTGHWPLCSSCAIPPRVVVLDAVGVWCVCCIHLGCCDPCGESEELSRFL